ncbi:MAG: helix-turn-helix domain-containing protein [Phycisphaerales bacterium]
MNCDEALPAFPSTLRRRRQALRLTLEEVAQRAGCAKSYLSALENGHKAPPSEELIARLETSLSFDTDELLRLAQLDRMPGAIRRDLQTLQSRDRTARTLARALSDQAAGGGSLDDMFRSGEHRAMIDRLCPSATQTQSIISALPTEIPLINKVTAGYPAEFTDLGYPARVADEYVRAPDVNDPDAFAARVVGDSMTPDYREGDIVVFSPNVEVRSGMDCFVRFEPDHETTFKRIYFETGQAGEELIRVQPMNNRYPSKTVPREGIAGLYAGVSVIRSIRALGDPSAT